MNVLRKAMSEEVAALKPLLDRAYSAILRFQRDRASGNEAEMRAAMEPAIEQLMTFRALLPAYKQRDFQLLEQEWRTLAPHDLIMLFDHCISIMHVRLERKRPPLEAHQPWTAEMLRLLDSYRKAPAQPQVEGDYLCSGIAASGGRASGVARVVLDDGHFEDLRTGEILVCRFTRPDLASHFRRARAVVTDEGGMLSHAAIVAREMQLPAVTGCGNATSAVTTGALIQVDGDIGLVMALERAV